MSTYKFQPGEIVDVTIKGARVLDHDQQNVLVLRYADDTDDSSGRLVYVGAEGVTVERVAPAEWPPQPGDIWAGPTTERWFAAMYLGDPDIPKDWEGCNSEGWRVALVPLEIGPYGGSEERPDDALRTRGPLTLVHREGASS